MSVLRVMLAFPVRCTVSCTLSYSYASLSNRLGRDIHRLLRYFTLCRLFAGLMFEPITERRYLIPFKAARLPQQVADVLVIGGGVAGLRAAIAAAEEGADVLILAKETH